MEAEELSWCPSWSNSLWQGWSYGLVHCPGRNATEPIWRVLASSDGISSWTPLKPQHSNCWPINCGVLTSLLLPHLSSTLTDSLPPLNLLCHSKKWCLIHARCSKSSLKHSIRFFGVFCKFQQNLLHIVLLKCPHVQIAFLKFTSADNQALVVCITIPAVAVPLNLKS